MILRIVATPYFTNKYTLGDINNVNIHGDPTLCYGALLQKRPTIVLSLLIVGQEVSYTDKYTLGDIKNVNINGEPTLFYRALLQKRPTIVMSLLIVCKKVLIRISILLEILTTLMSMETQYSFIGLFCKRDLQF